MALPGVKGLIKVARILLKDPVDLIFIMVASERNRKHLTMGTRAKNKVIKRKKEGKKVSPFILLCFLLPISFHLNFEALVARVEAS